MSNLSPPTILLWISILIKQLLSKLSAFHWFQFPIASVQRWKRYSSEYGTFKTHSHLFPFQKNIGTKVSFYITWWTQLFLPKFPLLDVYNNLYNFDKYCTMAFHKWHFINSMCVSNSYSLMNHIRQGGWN